MNPSYLRRLAATKSETLLRVACWLGLAALPMMVTSVFVPTVWPVLIALSVGQALGSLSFALFLVSVARDLGVAQRLRRRRDHDSTST